MNARSGEVKVAEKKFSKGSEEWQMFCDYWNLCQSLWVPECDEGYWKVVADEVEKFYQKHKSQLAKDWSVALLNDLEIKARE